MEKMTRRDFLKITGTGITLTAVNVMLTPTAFAATSNVADDYIAKNVNKTTQKLMTLAFYGVKPEIVTFSGGLSGVKTQTKKAYLSTAGDYLGTVTLQYQTMVSGGRPQFAYDTVKMGYDFSSSKSYYAVGSPSVNYTGDKITVYFPAQFGILVDEAVVEFTP